MKQNTYILTPYKNGVLYPPIKVKASGKETVISLLKKAGLVGKK